MVELLDIGNSAAKMATVSPEGGVHNVRSCRLADFPEYLTRLIEHRPTKVVIAASGSDGIVLTATETLERNSVQVGLLKNTASLPFASNYAAGQAGIDRLANVAAACNLGNLPAIVIDAGSAITLEVVSSTGCFTGGAILPGLKMQAMALSANTARLPLAVLNWEIDPAGANTQSAIGLGILQGTAGAVERLLEHFTSQLGTQKPALYITGGDAMTLTQVLRSPPRFVPELTLSGLVLLAKHNNLL